MRALFCMAFLAATPAAAQTVSDCDWQTSARNIPEPWADHTQTFADGSVRLALLDTLDPAAGALHILVLSPPYDELGDRQCKTIGASDQLGFSGVRWEKLTSSYNPQTGLLFEVPITTYNFDTESHPTSLLSFTLNQATGDIDAVVLAVAK